MSDAQVPGGAPAADTGFAGGDSAPEPVSYSNFERTVHSPSSPVGSVGTVETHRAGALENSKPATKPKSAPEENSVSARIAQLARREAAAAEKLALAHAKAERAEQIERRLTGGNQISEAQARQEIQSHAAKVINEVTRSADKFPLVTGLGAAKAVPAVIHAYWVHTGGNHGGKVLSATEAAAALESYYEQRYRAAYAKRNGSTAPGSRAAPVQWRADDRRADGNERMRRAKAAMDAVMARRGSR